MTFIYSVNLCSYKTWFNGRIKFFHLVYLLSAYIAWELCIFLFRWYVTATNDALPLLVSITSNQLWLAYRW